jgi:4a-hydroxytetrahydrobiopterin dehydratase
MDTVLMQNEVDRLVAGLNGWSQADNSIQRTFQMVSFPAALMFASAVGQLAEKADHHPDILIRYRKVTLTLSTHSAGGLTEKDIALAAQINAIV